MYCTLTFIDSSVSLDWLVWVLESVTQTFACTLWEEGCSTDSVELSAAETVVCTRKSMEVNVPYIDFHSGVSTGTHIESM